MGRSSITDAEVLQEILHRYVTSDRNHLIGQAMSAILDVVDEVFPIERPDVELARDIVLGARLSARDAIHVAVMRRRGIEPDHELRPRLRLRHGDRPYRRLTPASPSEARSHEAARPGAVNHGMRSGQHASMEEVPDAQVIARSLDEPRVFATLFDRHYDSVHRYLSRRVGWDIADDLTAETFTTAFDVRRRYDRDRPDARPWLFGIATRLVSHHRRSEGRRLHAYARLEPASDDDGGLLGSEGRLDAADIAPVIAAALARLAARDRDVVLLFAWADLRYEEIAVALGIPVGTVRSRLHRARQQLRERVRASGRYLSDDVLTEVSRPNG